MASDSRLQQLAKTGRNPAEETEYKKLLDDAGLQYFQGGNTSSTQEFNRATGYGVGGNYSADVASMAKQMQEANKPVVESLQASIPEISAKYQTERERLSSSQSGLEKRYDQLIADITGNQKAEEGRTQTATSQELGRRGISAESGLFSKTINEALSPVSQYYTGQINTAGLSREDAIKQLQDTIASLVGQETEATRGIQNTIAGVQSSGNQQALQSALSMYSLQSQAQENALNRALQEEQLGQSATQTSLQNALQQAQFLENIRQFNVTQTAAEKDAALKASRSGGLTATQIATNAKNELLANAKGGALLSDLVVKFGGSLPISDIVKLYTGVGFYRNPQNPSGAPTEPWAQEILKTNTTGGWDAL